MIDWVGVEQAAEQTIAAAAAVLLWDGGDSAGVLAHVAGTTATRMAMSRRGYELVCAVCPPDGFVDDELLHALGGAFEVAALPAPAASDWARLMSVAMFDAMDDGGESNTSAAIRARSMPYRHTAVAVRPAPGSARLQALWVCSLWRRNPPLPVDLIERGSRLVSLALLPPQLA